VNEEKEMSSGRGLGHGRGCGGRGRGRRGEGHGRGGGWGAPLEPAVLAALAAGSLHGYDLRAAVEKMTGSLVSADPGGLYRLLRRLEDDGMVTSAWTEGSHGPQRRQYQLTPEGQETLTHWHEHLRQRATALQAIVNAIDTALGNSPRQQADPENG
jgi:DNA-binding PadR family transcriptional regulator